MSGKYLATVAAVVLGLGLAQQPASAAPVLYGTTGSGGTASSLYTIDPTTGAATLVGAIGFNEVVSIDFNPLTGVLYGISNTGAGTLITINTATGAGTAVATLSPGFQSPDMSFSPTGTLYSWSEASPDHLNRINITTGATTDVGPSGIGTARMGLDVNSAGVVYVKSLDDLYTVNTTTGAATLVVTLTGAVDGTFDNVLAFDNSDTLYTVDRVGSTNSGLYTVDITTGATTFIGNTGLGRLAALAFAPGAVPEPGTLAILGLGLAGLGWSRRRK